MPVDLHCHYRRCLLRHDGGQCAGACADFQHHVVFSQFGCVDDDLL